MNMIWLCVHGINWLFFSLCLFKKRCLIVAQVRKYGGKWSNLLFTCNCSNEQSFLTLTAHRSAHFFVQYGHCVFYFYYILFYLIKYSMFVNVIEFYWYCIVCYFYVYASGVCNRFYSLCDIAFLSLRMTCLISYCICCWVFAYFMNKK